MDSTTLFKNTGGTKEHQITLSQSIADFKIAEVFYKTDDGHFSSCKILSPSGKIASLVAVGAESGGTVRIKIANRQFSGNTFNYISNGTGTLSANSGGVVSANNDQSIYVTEIIGYK